MDMASQYPSIGFQVSYIRLEFGFSTSVTVVFLGVSPANDLLQMTLALFCGVDQLNFTWRGVSADMLERVDRAARACVPCRLSLGCLCDVWPKPFLALKVCGRILFLLAYLLVALLRLIGRLLRPLRSVVCGPVTANGI